MLTIFTAKYYQWGIDVQGTRDVSSLFLLFEVTALLGFGLANIFWFAQGSSPTTEAAFAAFSGPGLTIHGQQHRDCG